MRRFATKALFFLWIIAVIAPSRAIADYSLAFWDVPLTVGAAGISVLGTYQYQNMDVPSSEDRVSESDLLPWDRPLAGRYSEFADNLSDGMAVFAIAPLVLGGATWYNGGTDGKGFATLALMYAQAMAIQNGLNLMARSLQVWPRPYIYSREGKGAEVAASADGEAYGSFFSGHASAAFTAAVFTAEWFSEMYPNSPYKGIMWASSLSLAGFVGALRIAAGKHYLTDVVAGALVGTGVSFVILKSHENKTKKAYFDVGLGHVAFKVKF